MALSHNKHEARAVVVKSIVLFQMRKKDQINIESKLKTVRYLGKPSLSSLGVVLISAVAALFTYRFFKYFFYWYVCAYIYLFLV